MRASEADILIIPGFRGSDPEHWQSRWEAKLPSARRVLQEDWERPKLAAWRAAFGNVALQHTGASQLEMG